MLVAHPLLKVRTGTPAAAIAEPKVWRRAWQAVLRIDLGGPQRTAVAARKRTAS